MTITIPTQGSEASIHAQTQGGLSGAVGAVEQRYDGHMDWDGGGAWAMFGMMAIFWLGIIGLGWWAITSYNRRHASANSGPIEVAKLRYARGEIGAEEFERLKRELGG